MTPLPVAVEPDPALVALVDAARAVVHEAHEPDGDGDFYCHDEQHWVTTEPTTCLTCALARALAAYDNPQEETDG